MEGSEELKSEWHQEPVAEACWIHCSDKDRNHRRKSRKTYPSEAELAVAREGYPLTAATEERLVVAVVEQLCGWAAEERRRRAT